MHFIEPSSHSARAVSKSLQRVAAASVVALATVVFAPANAEPMFVIDKVLINVYAEPNQEARKVTTLETGDTVEAVDQLEPYIKVRLTDGREGWVRGNYLSKQAPAIIRLKELQSEQPAPPAPQQGPPPELIEELEALKKQRTVLEGEVARLHQEAASRAAALPEPAKVEKPEPVRQAVLPPVPIATPEPSVRNRMWAWFAATVTAGALGFLLGYQTLATRIKRKYGSIKIY